MGLGFDCNSRYNCQTSKPECYNGKILAMAGAVYALYIIWYGSYWITFPKLNTLAWLTDTIFTESSWQFSIVPSLSVS